MHDYILHAASAAEILAAMAEAGLVVEADGHPLYSGLGWDLTPPTIVSAPTGNMIEVEGAEVPEIETLAGLYACLRWSASGAPPAGILALVDADPPANTPSFGPLPELPAKTFKPLSAMQLAAILLRMGKITAPEARAFGRAGVIPQAIEAGVVAALTAAGLPEDEQQIALLMLESVTEYRREHPLTPIMGQAINLDAAELDFAWSAGAQIL